MTSSSTRLESWPVGLESCPAGLVSCPAGLKPVLVSLKSVPTADAASGSKVKSSFATERFSIATERFSFATERFSFATERSSFATERSSFATERSYFAKLKSSFAADKAPFTKVELLISGPKGHGTPENGSEPVFLAKKPRRREVCGQMETVGPCGRARHSERAGRRLQGGGTVCHLGGRLSVRKITGPAGDNPSAAEYKI